MLEVRECECVCVCVYTSSFISVTSSWFMKSRYDMI